MPINKFGRYLNGNSLTLFGDKQQQQELDFIDCGGKRLQHVSRGIYQLDCINKQQFEDSTIHSMSYIKDNTSRLDALKKRIENLEKRITNPTINPAARLPSPTLRCHLPLLPNALNRHWLTTTMVKKEELAMSKADVVLEIYKYARKKFPRRRFIQRGMDDTWQIDLIDMQKYSRDNAGHKYIFTCIDTFSKYLWLQPIKSKNKSDTTAAMSRILQHSQRCPKNVQSDDGKEFFNGEFQELMKKWNINHYSTFSILKASIVERVIRTVKHWLWQTFALNGSYNWTRQIQALAKRYNSKVHSTISMAPEKVNNNNSKRLLNEVYSHRKVKPNAKYKVGDHVRISKYKTIFTKGYTGNWSAEIFKIAKVKITQPVTYLLQDEKNEPTAGCFYEQELQKVKNPDIYLVEKVLKKKGNKVYVKWLGLDEKSWIDKSKFLK
jgi:hypothetical protein